MWHFVSPRIVFGEEALCSLREIQAKRVLLVTDQNLVSLGIADQVLAHLRAAKIETRVFDQIEPDPTLAAVEQGVIQANDFKPDWIIGLGGGSPLDAAKAVWVMYERPDLVPAGINPFIQLGLRKKAHLITIPTTSGTGAEVTWAIVLTDQESKRKMGLGNRENVADLALVDPALAAKMPPQLTADTGLDALTHAIEGFICTWHTDLTDGLCLYAARDVFQYLPLAFEASHSDKPDQDHFLKAREKMHNAATSAGLGFGNAMASLAHAMGHVLGSAFQIPHGRAVGICLPYTIEFAASQKPDRISVLENLLGIHNQNTSSGSGLASSVRDLIATLDTPLHLAGLGISKKDFEAQLEKLVDDAFNDTQIITAPRAPSYQELEDIFRHAYRGDPVDF